MLIVVQPLSDLFLVFPFRFFTGLLLVLTLLLSSCGGFLGRFFSSCLLASSLLGSSLSGGFLCRLCLLGCLSGSFFLGCLPLKSLHLFANPVEL